MNALAKRVAVVTLLSLPLAGCSNDFERPSEIVTLRVLAVRADQPFTSPGSQPQLTMLLRDGSPRAMQSDGTRRRVRVVWLGGCVNPAGDMCACQAPVILQSPDVDFAA